jgi:hypothetical protein
MFRQSTKDSILSIGLHINGCEWSSSVFEVVVRVATLLAYADGARAVPTAPATATVTAGVGSPNNDEDGQTASAQAVVSDANADDDDDAEGRFDDYCVPWDAWGPRTTTVSDSSSMDWRYVLGERRATMERYTNQICIHDYNPYRIQQARASLAAKNLVVHGREDFHEQGGDEGQWNAGTFHPKVTRRIIESSMVQGGQWFQKDVTTALPHLEIVVDVPGCSAIYMEQDQILLHVGELDKVSGVVPL